MIHFATGDDIEQLLEYDKHISRKNLEDSIQCNRVYIIETDGQFAGWLRYNLFWDNTPFLNMLYILENNRESGYGRQLVQYWESQMRASGYRTVMTSTVATEAAQHFYYRLGYIAIGGFLSGQEPYELILEKEL